MFDYAHHGFLPSIRAMAHDEVDLPSIVPLLHSHSAQLAYPEPYIYKPERFLTDDGKLNPAIRDPASFVFGVRTHHPSNDSLR